MAPDSQTLPCPARNDWRAILTELQGRGVTLGAIHDHAYEYGCDGRPAHEVNEIWAQLGSRANATLTEVDVLRFAGAVGLLSPDNNQPYPPDWIPDRTPTWQGEAAYQGQSRVDDELRGLSERDDSEEQTGIERLYGEDEL
jgi:hypothetical protein